ncbi:MAG: helix-turn-helix domain-containing protein, partial [Oleispira sp.]|nr:helix-turn-helix domain-containing protein [Oleispira sp.]
SFRDIINQVRAEMAMDLIRRDDLSTDEIAARVGFEELSSFYRFFKNITGKGVKEIRESLSE